MSLVTPLFAQAELIGIIIMILVFVVPVIWQAINKQRQQPRPPPARPRPPGPPAAGVEDEVGEFLRRAGRQRGPQQQAPLPRRPPQPIVAEAVAPPPDQQRFGHQRPVGAGMAEHVEELLDTDKFERRAAQLGDEVAQSDEQLDQRLHQVFDHKLGRLAETPGESAAAPEAESTESMQAMELEDLSPDEFPVTAAAGLSALFSDAVSIRQAIIIHEVLTRPEQRWT